MWERLKLAGLVTKVSAGVYFRIWWPVVLWLAIAWYFDISFVIALLVFIAVSLSTLSLVFHMYLAETKSGTNPKVQRDFYVVTDTNYRCNILQKASRVGLKPYTLDSVYAFDSFEAAKAKFDAVSNEHYPFEAFFPWLEYPESYMDGSEYTEYEARLWVIPASSKQEAYDEAFYHDTRRLLGYGSGASASHLVLITDNDKRRQEYKAWWHERMDYQRYLDSRTTYLKEHPDMAPEFAEALSIEQWRSDGSEYWKERALPGHSSGA